MILNRAIIESVCAYDEVKKHHDQSEGMPLVEEEQDKSEGIHGQKQKRPKAKKAKSLKENA